MIKIIESKIFYDIDKAIEYQENWIKKNDYIYYCQIFKTRNKYLVEIYKYTPKGE